MPDIRPILFLLLLTPALGAQNPVSISLSLDRDSAGVGEPIALELISDESLERGKRWNWPTLSVGDSLPQGWEILEVSALDSTASPVLEAGIRRTQKVVVLAWDTGVKVIEPFSLTDSTGIGASTEAALVEIGWVNLDPDSAPKPMQGFKSYEWTLWEQLCKLLPWLGLLVVAVLLSWWGWRSWKRRTTEPEPEPVVQGPQEPAYAAALRMLRALEHETPWERGLGKEAQATLSEAVRLHLQGSFGVKALERTTREVSETLNQAPVLGLPEAEARWVIALLERSDLVKFAKQNMDGDAHLRVIRESIAWVERTMPAVEKDSSGDANLSISSVRKNG